MTILNVIVLAVIVSLSAIAVYLSPEPLDTVTETEAALNGIGIQPLVSKVATDGVEAQHVGKGRSTHKGGKRVVPQNSRNTGM